MFQLFLHGTSRDMCFTKLCQPAPKYCNSLVMYIPFTKAKPKEKQGVKCFGDIGALFYVIKLRRLAHIQPFDVWCWELDNHHFIRKLDKENIRIFNGLLKHH